MKSKGNEEFYIREINRIVQDEEKSRSVYWAVVYPVQVSKWEIEMYWSEAVEHIEKLEES